MSRLRIALAIAFWCGVAPAHDPWVETNVSSAHVGEAVDVELKLGNHGNNHRDFKLAGRLSPDATDFFAISPTGKKLDLRSGLVSTAASPKEGFWVGSYVLAEPGLHVVVQSSDKVVKHGALVRSIRSSKAFVLAAESLDKAPAASGVAAKPLGLPFEIVLDTCPAAEITHDQPITVRVLRGGKPKEKVRVAFIPRGATLKEGFDPQYERLTDAAGKATWTPTQSTTVLVVARFDAPDEKTSDYTATSYAATVTVRVPRLCPCDLAASGRGTGRPIANRTFRNNP